jgi:hypothetical protein
METMTDRHAMERIEQTTGVWQAAGLSRRRLLKRGAALGLAASAAGFAGARRVSAQESGGPSR